MSAEAGRRYQHVVFDFDGVICDSLNEAMRAFNAIRDARFPQLPRVESRDDMTLVYGGSLRTCLNAWLTPTETAEFFDLHSAQMVKVAATLRPFPGVARVLSNLGEGRVSIVTSAYSDAVLNILSTDADFDASCLHKIAGRELRMTKTDKINAVLAELGLSAADAVYVGDLESDILYCRAVPMDIIVTTYGYHPESYLADKGAAYLVSSVAELDALLTDLVKPVRQETAA
jgi:phosphoglycolate phosphatase